MGPLGVPETRSGGGQPDKQVIRRAEVRQPVLPLGLPGCEQVTSPLGVLICERDHKTHLMDLPTGLRNEGCTAQLSEQLEWENLTMSSVGEDVEQLELSYTAGGGAK